MDSGSQDVVAQIEAALGALRRDQLRGRMRRGPGGPGFGGHGDLPGGPGFGRPPWGDGAPPWGDGPPPWKRGGPHERLMRGAARLRLLDALRLAESSGTRLGISEIAETIGVDQPRASRLVNEAAERGLVTRRADEKDARRSVVELTESGRAILETTRETRRSAVSDALAGFSDAEAATFAALFTRFVDGMHRDGP